MKKELGPEEALTSSSSPLFGQAGTTRLAYAAKVGDRDYPPKSELLTPKQAAALLGVTCQTIKNYIYRGKLKTFKTPGGHHRIHREHIMELGLRKNGPSRDEILEICNDLHQGFINTLEALTDALDARDGIASGHSRRVANYVAVLTEIVEIPGEDQEAIKLGALLHDVGKIFISEQILSKPGRLTEQEHYFIRQHPEIGERVISRVEFLRLTKPLIRHHHERFDGKGYPDTLAGEEIPLGARMIFIADAFDRITSECTYESARDLGAAIHEIERHAGTQFDPEIVKTFLEEVVSKLHNKDMGQPVGTCVFRKVGSSQEYQYPVCSGY